ncbi:hypothetical protein E4T38_01622 [Aureobasidium subglaciale]|nr:hypothetical protein E4T38_01622 [Aureobasidium subglaciale]KAI5222612.1 hypothetical protein E4T40_04839 [Aureobasidium subglaciale]KAI5233051.1 hypothetical protein E4T41_01620 [Aureobasidium subglaciale]KAI5262290.1 hypothetical protein E4T46_04551 [Aureobasidium subglaciale]
MNWTGGNLQRHSKSKGNAVVARQRSHFAKARSKAPSTKTRSVEGWNDTSPIRDPCPPPLKKIRTRTSPRIQERSMTGQRTGRRLVGDFVLPSRESDVRSTNSMLLDDFDQTNSRFRALDGDRSYQMTPGPDNSLTPPRVLKHMQFSLSDSLDTILRDHKANQHPSGSEAHALSMVGNVASSGDASNNTSAEDMQSIPDTAERPKGSPVKLRPEQLDISVIHAHADATNFSHEDSVDNDVTWRRFIDEEESDNGQIGSDLYTAPQYMMQALPNALPTLKLVQEEPLCPSSHRGSTPHSSCPTARACLLETGRSRRIGGETSERGPRLSDEDQVWMRFVLGLDCSDGS